MGDDVQRANRIVAHQLGDRRLRRGLRVEEQSHTASLEEGDAPAVRMHVGFAAALLEAGEREADVGGNVAVHPE
jgi:hypothetical protein